MKEVFIGCSGEGLVYAQKLKELLNKRLQKYNIRCILWNDDGVFPVGKTTIESLYKKACELKNNEGYAIMLMTPDDKIEFRGQVRYAPRDNVVFELGLFLGFLGRNRTYCIAPFNNQIKMMSDWFGVTNATYKFARRPKAESVEERLNSAVNRIVKTIDGVERPKIDNNKVKTKRKKDDTTKTQMNKNIFQVIENGIEEDKESEKLKNGNGFIYSID